MCVCVLVSEHMCANFLLSMQPLTGAWFSCVTVPLSLTHPPLFPSDSEAMQTSVGSVVISHDARELRNSASQRHQ